MFEQVKPLLKPSAASMQVAGVISLYIWSIYFRSSYTSFLMGVFTTLATEAFLFWQFLTKKILKESGQKISIELGNSYSSLHLSYLLQQLPLKSKESLAMMSA